MRLFPKEENFFNYFEELANKIEEGGQFFLEMTKNRDYSAAKVSRLKELEHEADGITHKTYERMHKTFLTPIDREDIYALVNKMDSIMDVIEATAIRIHMYKVKKPDDEIIKQAEILFQAIKKIKEIVHGLRNMKNCQDDSGRLRGNQHPGKCRRRRFKNHHHRSFYQRKRCH